MAQGSSTRRGTSIATCTLALTLTLTIPLTLTLSLTRHLDRHVQPSEVEAAGGQSLGRRHLPALLPHLLDLGCIWLSPLDLAGLEMRRIHRAPQPPVLRCTVARPLTSGSRAAT